MRLTSISDLSMAELEELAASLGEAKYRAKQLARGLYQSQALSFAELTDLPLGMREKLSEGFVFESLEMVAHRVSTDGLTEKFLFKLRDGRTIETVAMYYSPSDRGKGRCTLCLSTQVGCAIGCPFCATGRQGFERNLHAGEITDQVLYFARRLSEQDAAARVTNVVFMGMGEPLANYQALWQAIKRLNAPWGFGLGARHFTVSTAGLVPGIEKLSRETMQIGLAVSLHAPTNELRNKLVPINKTYPLEVLIPACREYATATRRRISFEYALIQGTNDGMEQADRLASLLKSINCHVNLIPANAGANSEFRPSLARQAIAFQARLEKSHINATIREERGADIDAGCGQLRSQVVEPPSSRRAAI